MKTLQQWFFRILWWLTFVVIVSVIIVLSNRDWIARELMERQIHKATGMDPVIGNFSFRVLDPKVMLDDFKLYNAPDFGGTLFLDMPELHIAYDRAALRRHELHITFMRIYLREMDVVKNADGTTNLMSFINMMAPLQSDGSRTVTQINGCKFTGIDVLNLSIGVVRFVDLKDRNRNRMVTIGFKNLIYTNVVSSADFPGLSEQLWRRGGSLVGLPVYQPIHKTDTEPETQTPAP